VLQKCQYGLELVQHSLRFIMLQRWAHETAMSHFDLENLLSVITALQTDLWALFEDVLVIFMRWSY
jgi:hypothetical protein